MLLRITSCIATTGKLKPPSMSLRHEDGPYANTHAAEELCKDAIVGRRYEVHHKTSGTRTGSNVSIPGRYGWITAAGSCYKQLRHSLRN